MKSRDLLAVKLALLATWAPAALATTITLGSSLAAVPVLAWALVAALSSISGVAALLGKLKDSAPARPYIFIAAHMLGSVLSGVLAFFVLSGMGSIDDFFQVVIISVASYAGASLLDAAAEGMNVRVRNVVGKDKPAPQEEGTPQ